MSDLPSSWARATIREIAHTSSGGTPSRSRPDYFSGSVPWVKSGELNDGHVHSTEEAITEEGLRNSSAKIFPAGTVCIALYGATVGKTAILGIDASTNQAVCGIQPKDGIRRNYLFYFLQSQRANLVSLSQGGAQPNISQELVRATEIPIAPSNEQDRIVAEIEKQFTRLDAATAALKRVQANLKRYRASVLKAACEGRLVPTEAELARKEGRDYEPADQLLQRILRERRAHWEADTLAKMIASGKPPKDDRWKGRYKEPTGPVETGLPELPNGWGWATTDQITSLVTDGEHITPERSDSGVYLLSARNVREGELFLETVDYISRATHEQLCTRLRIIPGDVLLSCSGSVGRSCVVPEGIEFSLVRSVAVLKPLGVVPQYLSFALRSLRVQEQIRAKSTQTAQSNIFQAQIKSLVIPLPPLAEQCRIVESCSFLLDGVSRLNRHAIENLARTDRLRRAILSDAFSGRLGTQDPSDEPASVMLARIHEERGIGRAGSKPRRKEEPAYA